MRRLGLGTDLRLVLEDVWELGFERGGMEAERDVREDIASDVMRGGGW
jgi:hypothetical protein